MNSDYFITNILEPLEQKMFPNGRKSHAKWLTVHLVNCSTHTGRASWVFMAEHNMTRLKHPPYSRDPAPSDFYLFPTIKERLTCIQMVDEEDLFYRLRKLLNEIPVRELRKVFDSWIKRLTAVIRGDGSYISWWIKLLLGSSTFNLDVQLAQRLIDETTFVRGTTFAFRQNGSFSELWAESLRNCSPKRDNLTRNGPKKRTGNSI
jgi:hypothetical protein